jgi:hypothetical protein
MRGNVHGSAITGGGYDYAEARNVFVDLPTALKKLGPKIGARLRNLLPAEVAVASVGDTLHNELMPIIAVSWSPAGSVHALNAVVDDVVARVPKRLKNIAKRALASEASERSRRPESARSTKPLSDISLRAPSSAGSSFSDPTRQSDTRVRERTSRISHNPARASGRMESVDESACV